MPTSIVDADSLLAIDVGSVTTRALLFDVVDGRYHFLAFGSAPTTVGAPYGDISEGIRRAIDHLELVTGRTLIDKDERLIIPSQSNGSGVDTCVGTLSAGRPLKVVTVGLLEDVSSESAQRLASTIYSQVVDSLSLNDRRKQAARLDAVLRARPDLIIVAGGTEGGASHSVMNLIESVGLACYQFPKENPLEVLFVGNQDLADEVENTLGSLANLTIAPNVRPSLDVEQLAPAQPQLAKIYRSVRMQTMAGAPDLDAWTGGRLIPTSNAFGRIVRFLSHVYEPAKGVLGVDIGGSSVNIAAAFSGELYQGVYSDLGMGEQILSLFQSTSLEEITRWLPVDVPEVVIKDYVYNKQYYPQALPANSEQLAIEQALARQALVIAARRLLPTLPGRIARSGTGLLPWFEPIVAAGGVLTNAPTPGQCMLMLLDGLQPTGVTTLAVDQNNIMSALGAASQINSVLPVQVLESSTFLNLGTVISVTGNLQIGAPALRARITQDGGNESTVDVKFGSLEVIPLPLQQPATLQLQPLNRADVGMGGPGRSGTVRVKGGIAGVIVDARGRPLRLPKDTARRQELMKKWLWNLGG